jgi:uncharacterized protein YchJ
MIHKYSINDLNENDSLDDDSEDLDESDDYYDNYDEIKESLPIINQNKKIGRNDPCPCGSGKKYKKCCLKN